MTSERDTSSKDGTEQQDPTLPPLDRMGFEELATRRRLLQNFCRLHARSLLKFRDQQSPGFKLTLAEPSLRRAKLHLTTSATCIASLLACPEGYQEQSYSAREAAEQFAATALKTTNWTSESSAHIYCRCRALPLTIKYLRDYDDRVEHHIRRILRQLEYESKRFAIGEADVVENPSPEQLEKARRAWYPPNAFHTYWALDVLRCFRTRFPERYQVLEDRLKLPRIIDGMILWSRRTLGYQVALHAAASSILDSDQLAWSLATLLQFESPRFPADLGDQDLLRESLKRLFGTQLPIGTWRHYRSLFHYREAGNAYCYVYETFSVLLNIALDAKSGRQLFRDILRPYAGKLTRLWQYAESTRISLETPSADEPSAVGWCSEHRLNQKDPDSSATPSVFWFAQALRRLLGVWTREAARRELNLVQPTIANPKKILADRGDTWPESNRPGVTEQLYTMFINPIACRGPGDTLEPDTKPIGEEQSRSAILFGPPGTSKTTLCEAVANSIGWDYVELHASHFVADGLQNVQRKADEIFRRLMEIDRAVVLFDEIDELVREREGEHDAFGRFLTTSMLPKLAELWQQRKVLYFVATNHIKEFDRAITRSQRFDALIFVSPPSYDRKIRRLENLLAGNVTWPGGLPKRMWDALQEAGRTTDVDAEGLKRERDGPLDPDRMLAKFVLLRWDQLDELAVRLKAGLKGGVVTEEMMRDALAKIDDRKLLTRAPYIDFISDRQYPRRDFDKELVWIAEGFDKPYEPDIVKAHGKYWLKVRRSEFPPRAIDGFRFIIESHII